MYPTGYDIYAVIVQLAFSLIPKLVLGLILMIPLYFVVRRAVRTGIHLAGEDAKRIGGTPPNDDEEKRAER